MLVIFSEENLQTFLPLSWFYLLPPAANAEPQPHLAFGIILLGTARVAVPVVALGVHREHLE